MSKMIDHGDLSSLMTNDDGEEIRIATLFVNGDDIDIQKAG